MVRKKYNLGAVFVLAQPKQIFGVRDSKKRKREKNKNVQDVRVGLKLGGPGTWVEIKTPS